MSLLTMSPANPRSSAFTFESSVHSSHVLSRLDDQRRRDVLCDLTVVVEGERFRAHRSVLASCSQYFTNRVSSHAGQGLILTLPAEVTVSGFEPLLSFAYTSKLLFSKDNAIEIRSCASILGFKDLDQACFDFLLPKFFPSTRASAPLLKKTCCKTRCKKNQSASPAPYPDAVSDTLSSEKGVCVSLDSPSEQQVAAAISQPGSDETGSKNRGLAPPPQADIQSDVGPTYDSLRCPKYPESELVGGKRACGLEKCPGSPAVVTGEGCPSPGAPPAPSCPPSSGDGGRGEGPATEAPRRDVSQVKREADRSATGDRQDQASELCGVNSESYGVNSESRRVNSDSCRVNSESYGVNSESYGVNSESCRVNSESYGVNSESCRVNSESYGVNSESYGVNSELCGVNSESYGVNSELCGVKSESYGVNLESCGVKSESCGKSLTVEEREEYGKRSGDEEEADRKWKNRGMEKCGGGTSDRERSSVEREVAENLAWGLWSELSSPTFSLGASHRAGSRSGPESGTGNRPGPESGTGDRSGPGDRASQARSTTVDGPKLQMDPSSRTGSFACLQTPDPGRGTGAGSREADALPPGGEGSNRSAWSPYVSSLTSGEDGDSDSVDTEGDSESYASETAKKVQLPFSADGVASLSRTDFQQTLKQHRLTRPQLDFVHDARRRGKNRAAAQRCRKRKLDCIHNLECEIDKLRTEKEKLTAERNQLSQLKLKAWHRVSALYQRVCSEAALCPEQLQLLAKYSSADCPLSSLISSTEPLFAGLGEILQPQAPNSAFSAGPASDIHQTSFEPSPSCSRKMPACNEHSANGKAP